MTGQRELKDFGSCVRSDIQAKLEGHMARLLLEYATRENTSRIDNNFRHVATTIDLYTIKNLEHL